MPSAWRIVKRRRVAGAFDGEGARLHGGRWNSPGVAMVYCADSVSLALLEILVHVERQALLSTYSVLEVTFEPEHVEAPGRTLLPDDWRVSPPSAATQGTGDAWIREARSVVLEVPSAIVPMESNYLLNPHHESFSELDLGAPEDFSVDRRLVE